MTADQIRITVAEAMGWKAPTKDIPQVKADGSKEYDRDAYWTSPEGVWYFKDSPNFPADLNACTEMVAHEVKLVGFPFQEAYIRELRAIVTRRRRDCNEMQVDFWMAEATAHQRCEAFLRVKGLWKERQTAVQPCCENEKRNMNGGCDNCGDPAL